MLKVDQVHVIRHNVLVDGRSQRQVAKEFGISRVTVRKYVEEAVPVRKETAPRPRPVWEKVGVREQIGLLPRALRQVGGQRVYSRDDVERLTFIRRCREFDFSIDQVRALVAIVHDPESSCMDARAMAAD